MLKMTLKTLLITPWGQEILKHSVISDFEPELAGFFHFNISGVRGCDVLPLF